MLIDDLENKILEYGFIIPKFTDGIKVILYGEKEILYRFMLLIFYLLGCFKSRFYQYEVVDYRLERVEIRCASFHPIVWNPISMIAEIIFQVINYFYLKDMITIEIGYNMIINVKNNKAYVIQT